jgi:glutamate racemase
LIGVFDSGIGGLAVLGFLRAAYPTTDLLYYADTARLPYGGRSPALIRRFAREAGRLFSEWGADYVQVACGTVSSVALDEFAASANRPVSGVVRPVVSEIVRDGRRRVLILSTEATARSRVFETALATASPGISFLSLGCPLFVPLVENGYLSRNDPALLSIVGRTLAPGQTFFPDAILLGCTHFRLLSPLISSLFPGVPVYDCGEAAARAVPKEFCAGAGTLRVLVSDDPERFRRIASLSGSLSPGVPVGSVADELR